MSPLYSFQVSLKVVCGTETEVVFAMLAEGTAELFAPQTALCCDSVHDACSINYQY